MVGARAAPAPVRALPHVVAPPPRPCAATQPPKEKKKKLSKKEKEALKRAEQGARACAAEPRTACTRARQERRELTCSARGPARAERLAEEQRLADLAEAERLEKERLQREEEARIAAEIAAQKAAELEERRVIEDKENAPLYDQLAEKLETEAAKRGYAEEVRPRARAPHARARSRRAEVRPRARARAAQWGKYVACDSLPDVQSEAQVNTYITEWSETQATDLAHGLAEVERTGVVLSLLEESWQLARHERLRLLPRAPAQQPAAGAEEPGGAARGEAEEMWQPGALAQLASMTIEKLDEATGHILMHADELATTRNELQRAHEGGYLRYGLWVNLARNVRVKNVELPEISVSLELPKTLALAAVAITVHQFKHAHCSPSFAAPSQWIPLGGVTIIELLALPPIPKKVKGWTLRQVGTSGASVQRLAYPIPTVGGDTGTQSGVLPMRVTLNLGDDCVLQQPPPAHAAAAPTAPAGGAEGGKPEEGAAAPAPAELEDLTVGWWDADAREWSLDGVSEVKFSAATRTLSFLTTHLAPLAVLRPSHAELPYRRWLLTPLSPSHSVRARARRRARAPSAAARATIAEHLRRRHLRRRRRRRCCLSRYLRCRRSPTWW